MRNRLVPQARDGLVLVPWHNTLACELKATQRRSRKVLPRPAPKFKAMQQDFFWAYTRLEVNAAGHSP